MIEMLDGNGAASHAVKLSRVQSVPCFPVTPQTEVIEMLAKWKQTNFWNGEYRVLESEHAVISAAVASELTGARTFTASSSQGLELMHEILYIASGTRAPMVMVNVSRGLSAPITLWCDHNDFLSVRDCGWLMFACETNQEVMDTVPIAYKVSENHDVLLPSMVNMDGFVHSYTRTEVDIPSQREVDKFLPKLNLKIKLDTNKPLSLGVPAMDEYSAFRVQVHKAQLNALEVISEAQREWNRRFGRQYDLIERFHMNDADVVMVGMGANSTIMKAAVTSLRTKGVKAGFLRLRLIRPWPLQEIKEALQGVKKILVVDQNLAPGMGGILYPEVKALVPEAKAVVSNFIAGLGGKPVSQDDYEAILLEAKVATKPFRRFMI
ncbi:MAG: pyruvate ferredoxin oxidoreductase [Candidatus Aenigmatarchaeota archaeon]